MQTYWAKCRKNSGKKSQVAGFMQHEQGCYVIAVKLTKLLLLQLAKHSTTLTATVAVQHLQDTCVVMAQKQVQKLVCSGVTKTSFLTVVFGLPKIKMQNLFCSGRMQS